MTYRHTQSRGTAVVGLLVAAAVTAVAAALWGDVALAPAAGVLLAAALLVHALSSMTTTVTAEAVEIAFRWGRPRRRIPRSRVLGATAVRNRWWYGWGIRLIPGGTLFNVWGLDAVHLELDGRRDVRIGTDDPAGLVAALAGADDGPPRT